MIIGKKEFDVEHHTYIMGILNVTPDSFSDGGKYHSVEKALQHTQQMIMDGAAIIDIGGESTRPGYEMISDEEEIDRVVPVIERIRREFDIPISLDTYKAEVAKAGAKAGADLINDIWGLKYQQNIAKVIAENHLACCLMHNRRNMEYQDFLSDMETDLADSVYLAKKAGIDDDKIILDPGVGFAKSYENNLQAIASLERLRLLGYPVLLGTSRKSVIGLTLQVPPEERMAGTVVTSVFGVIKGAAFLRVHDIKENVQAVKMAEAILDR